MRQLFSLDERLQTCASLVRDGARLADIGTDHAYLPVWLTLADKISFSIAADINPQPLDSGRLTAEKYHVDTIDFRLGNGLEPLHESDKITDIVIAGMGGEMIWDIINSSPLTRNENLNIILQPMTKSEELIRSLYENGYEIIKQKCTVSHNKCYTVLQVHYCGTVIEPDELFCYIGMLDLTDEKSIRFVKQHIKNLENKSKGDKSLLPLLDKLKKACE